MKLADINIRDPFILPFEGTYYMYGSRVTPPYDGFPWGDQTGFDVYTSTDLENWSGPKSVFEKNDAFWGTRDFWAPEVHLFNGRFYMLASFKAPSKCRGTHILVSDTPDGTFVPVSEDPATPLDWECLDGTLYTDKLGRPHIVFCHEWVQIGDGTVCDALLSPDLTMPVAEPQVLFRASDFSNVKSVVENESAFVTDGPFLFRCDNGELICIWSSIDPTGYVELIARSDNGDIDGNWTVQDEPLSAEDGGHGMIFTDFEGKLRFIMHKPNTTTFERPVIMTLLQENGRLSVQK